MTRELLFKVTRDDLTETHIRGSGAGGQHRNKSHTGVRLLHRASGAVAGATEHRSQEMNRVAAWKRLRETPKWKMWFREMCLVTTGQPTVQQKIDESMKPENLRTQILDDNRWIDVDPERLM